MLYFYLLSFNFLGFISAMARKHWLGQSCLFDKFTWYDWVLNQISCTFLYLMVLQHVSKYSRAFQCCIVFLLLFVTDGIKRFFVPFKTCRQRGPKPRPHIKPFFPQLFITLNAYLLSLFTPNVTVVKNPSLFQVEFFSLFSESDGLFLVESLLTEILKDNAFALFAVQVRGILCRL